jgi:hypothetical protein
VRLKLTMTAGRAANSSACIAAGVCKPLGGYSVWSALPPLPPQPTPAPTAAAAADSSTSSSDSKPIVLVVAQMDSMEMFHDAAQVGGWDTSAVLLWVPSATHRQQPVAAGLRVRQRGT